MTTLETAGVPADEPPAGPAVPPQDAERPRSLSADLGALATSQAITWTFTLAATVVVPRLLGPAQMGQIVAATAVAGVLGVLLGLPTRDHLTRDMASAPQAVPRLLGTALLLRAALLPLFGLAVLGYGLATGARGSAALVLALCAGTAACQLLLEPLQSAFQASLRMQYLAHVEVVNKTLQTVGGAGLALLGLRAVGLSAYTLVIAVGVFVVAIRWQRRLTPPDLHASPQELVVLAREGLSYWTFGVFFMVYLWVDAVLLGVLAPDTVVGWYGAATRLFTTLMFLPSVLSTAYLPRLVAAYESGAGALHERARVPLETVAVLGLPVCAVTAATAPAVVGLLFGPAYGGAVGPLVLLAFCVPPMYVNVVLNQICVAQGRPGVWTRLMLVASVVNPVLNVVLVQLTQHRWGNGALGAATSLLVTELLICGLGAVLVARAVVDARLLVRVLKAAVCSAGAGLAMLAVAGGGLPAQLPVGLLVIAGAALLLRLPRPEELAALRGLLSRVTARAAR